MAKKGQKHIAIIQYTNMKYVHLKLTQLLKQSKIYGFLNISRFVLISTFTSFKKLQFVNVTYPLLHFCSHGRG